MKKLNDEVLEKVVGGRIQPYYPDATNITKKKDLVNGIAVPLKVRTTEWKTSPDKAIPSDAFD